MEQTQTQDVIEKTSTGEQFDLGLQKMHDERNLLGLSRELPDPVGKTDFSSNDYLGLSRIVSLSVEALKNLPAGSTGSRLVTGNSSLAEETERMIANFHRAEAALIFNSGYCANLGLFSCIAGKSDTFIADERIHASIIDGMRLSYAARYRFRHNDIGDLEKKLALATGKKLVAVESIYSMDGDEAPLRAIAEICKNRDALLIVDEAHATGLYGIQGEGLVAIQGLEKEVYARVFTFGKAIGLHGAAVAGSKVLRNHLINQARSFIFTTAPPPQLFGQLQIAYGLLPFAARERLFGLVAYFRRQVAPLRGARFIESGSPVQGLILGDNFKAKALAASLYDQGIFVKAMLSPTVPVGTERLRICLHAFNEEAEIDHLHGAIRAFFDDH